jgi:AraC family transcriptional regulator of arabinose operon
LLSIPAQCIQKLGILHAFWCLFPFRDCWIKAMILGSGMVDHPAGIDFTCEAGFTSWVLGMRTRGDIRIRVGDREVDSPAPALGLIRPRTRYRVWTTDDRRVCEAWVFFNPRPEWLPLLNWPEVLPGVMQLPGDDEYAAEARDVVEEVHRVANGALPERNQFADNLLERALLFANLANPHAKHPARHPAVSAALDIIATRSREPLDVRTLAREAGCSASRLAHLFSAQVGSSPMAWLEEQRIGRAKHLLSATSLPIKQIAAEVGFVNPFHFATRFRRHVGCSPTVYRRKPA